MAAFADFQYYTDTYGGSRIAADDFSRLSIMATAYINGQTRGRIASSVSDNIKNAMCAIADMMKSQEDGGERQSETNDGISVSYVTSGKTPSERMRATLETFLAGEDGNLLCAWV